MAYGQNVPSCDPLMDYKQEIIPQQMVVDN